MARRDYIRIIKYSLGARARIEMVNFGGRTQPFSQRVSSDSAGLQKARALRQSQRTPLEQPYMRSQPSAQSRVRKASLRQKFQEARPHRTEPRQRAPAQGRDWQADELCDLCRGLRMAEVRGGNAKC